MPPVPTHFLTRFAFAPLQCASWQPNLCGGCLAAGGQRGGLGPSFGRQPAGVGPADQRAAPADTPAARAGGGQRSAARSSLHTVKSVSTALFFEATKNKDFSTCQKAVETSFRFWSFSSPRQGRSGTSFASRSTARGWTGPTLNAVERVPSNCRNFAGCTPSCLMVVGSTPGSRRVAVAYQHLEAPRQVKTAQPYLLQLAACL